jgi:hypothetical protein
MALYLDHAYITCSVGAPEAEVLLEHGFAEGSPNVHPGQGTANRRFFFANFMLELLWVADPLEAAADAVRHTGRWERGRVRKPHMQGETPFIFPGGCVDERPTPSLTSGFKSGGPSACGY